MQVVTIVCAVLGAKIAVVLAMLVGPLKEFHDWGALLTGGRSSPAHCCSGFSGSRQPSPLLHMTSRRTIASHHSAVFDGNRPHRLPDRRLLPRGSFQRPLGDNLCGRHSAASGPDVRDDFRLGHGISCSWRSGGVRFCLGACSRCFLRAMAPFASASSSCVRHPKPMQVYLPTNSWPSHVVRAAAIA